MFHIRVEGEKLHNGFNFYGLSEWATSRGFIWRWNGYAKWFRYSVKGRKWIFEVVRLSDHPADIETEETVIIDLPTVRK